MLYGGPRGPVLRVLWGPPQKAGLGRKESCWGAAQVQRTPGTTREGQLQNGDTVTVASGGLRISCNP